MPFPPTRGAVTALLSLALFPATASATDPIVVKFRSDTAVAQTSAMKKAKVATDKKLALPQTVRVKVTGGQSTASALSALNKDPNVEWAQKDAVARPALTPSDRKFRVLWGLKKINAPAAWDVSLGDPEVTVAVIDTGVDFSHPDLATAQWTNPGETGGGQEANGVDDDGNGFVDDWRGWDFAGSDNDPSDDTYVHGTHVAGTIAARADQKGVIGVAPRATVMSLKACDAKGVCWESDMASAFAYAARMGARVANVSLISASRNLAMLDAISLAPETLYVAAAGNKGLDLDLPGNAAFPCEFSTEAPNVLCVGATDESDARATFSNFGSAVEVGAPGVNIVSTVLRGRWATKHGTSMAAPHVAGASALQLAVDPAARAGELRAAAIDGDVVTALPGKRLNAARAISLR